MSLQTSPERERVRVTTVHAAIWADPVLFRVALIGALWCVCFAGASLLVPTDTRASVLLGDVVYLVPVFASAALAVATAARRATRHRSFWVCVAAAVVCWLIGELLWAFLELVLEQEPYPSVADAFYLAGSALFIPAAVIGFGRRRPLRTWRAALDASVLVVAVAYFGATVLVAPQLADGVTLGTVVAAAYPLLSVATLMVLVSLAFSGHPQVPRAVMLVGLALAAGAVANVAYSQLAMLESFVSGSVVNVGWQIEAVLLCLAALVALRHDEGRAAEEAAGRDVGLVLVLSGLVACFALAGSDIAAGDVDLGSFALLAYAVAAVILRLVMTARESRGYASRLQHALVEQERLAVTDALTGLRNRRFFEEVIKLEVERVQRGSGGAGLLVIDLDHFKRVNDAYGHPAGDDVLKEAAARLVGALRTIDVVARYGGEEFVAVLPGIGAPQVEMLAERCRAAIGDEPFVVTGGATIAVTASVGAACHPVHSGDAEELMQVADAALYAAKDLGRDGVQVGRPRSGALEVLPKVDTMTAFFESLAEDIDERLAGWPRSQAVSRWSGGVAGLLGLGATETERCVAAGRLRDIGMMRVPDAVLLRPGPLDEEEWDALRRHPEHGERMLALSEELADVARVVGQHHERWDGTGYPARIAGNAICIEARIVAVCEAWAAMLSERPHHPALAVDAARAVLLDGAGRQFDSYVVTAFVELETAGRIGPPNTVAHPAQGTR